jgi:hypothetical protein
MFHDCRGVTEWSGGACNGSVVQRTKAKRHLVGKTRRALAISERRACWLAGGFQERRCDWSSESSGAVAACMSIFCRNDVA